MSQESHDLRQRELRAQIIHTLSHDNFQKSKIFQRYWEITNEHQIGFHERLLTGSQAVFA